MPTVQSAITVSRGDLQPTPAGSWTYSLAVSAGTNLRLVVQYAGPTAGLDLLTAITYNGVALTAVSGSESGAGPTIKAKTFELANPSTGTNDLVVTNTGNINYGAWTITVLDGSPVAGAGFNDFVGSGTSISPAATGVSGGAVAVMAANGLAGGGAAGASTTGIGPSSVAQAGTASRGYGGYSTTAAPTLTFTSGQIAGTTAVFAASGGGDTTPPTLTSPSATGGVLVCSGSVSSNEGNGTLYTVFTTSGTAPTAVQVEAGQDNAGAAATRAVSQAVSATGAQSVASGAIAAGTYTAHFMHKDAAGNRSAVVSSSPITVTASGTVYGFDLNSSTYAFKDNTGTPHNTVALTFAVYDTSTKALVATITGYSTNASGIVTTKVTHASLVNGTLYSVNVDGPSGTQFGRFKFTAA